MLYTLKNDVWTLTSKRRLTLKHFIRFPPLILRKKRDLVIIALKNKFFSFTCVSIVYFCIRLLPSFRQDQFFIRFKKILVSNTSTDIVHVIVKMMFQVFRRKSWVLLHKVRFKYNHVFFQTIFEYIHNKAFHAF